MISEEGGREESRHRDKEGKDKCRMEDRRGTWNDG